MAQQICDYIAQGFEKVAEWSVKLAEKAIEVLEKIVELAVRLFGKSLPGVGQIAGAVEWIVTGFDDFPYWDDVTRIKNLVQQVFTIHNKIEELALTVQNYLEAAQGLVDAVGSIPQINSTDDVAQIAKSMTSDTATIQEEQENFDKQKSELDGQLNDIEQTLNPSSR